MSRTTLTHCPYCSLQYGMHVTAGDRPATLVPADFPTTKGGPCAKGSSSTELLDRPERLVRPLVRVTPGDRSSPLVEGPGTTPTADWSTRSSAPRPDTAGTPSAAAVAGR